MSTKASTLKAYDKMQEVKNNAVTPIERSLVEASLFKGYRKEKVLACEMLRFELTLKGKDSIQKRLKPYLGDKVTFETMFKADLWAELLKNEVEQIFANPIKDFVFLSKLNAPVIEAFLNKNIKHFATKAILKETLSIIQTKGGLRGLKEHYFEVYQSRQTFYNHQTILKKLAKTIDFSELEDLTASKIHGYLLEQFQIKKSIQNKLL